MAKRKLACWWDGVHVADFETDDRMGVRLRCRYTRAALERWPTSTPAVSCSLPVQARRTDASNFLRGVLPEGRHLQSLADRAGVATNDTYNLLARYGRDLAGALVITPEATMPDVQPGRAEPYSDASLADEIAGLDENPLGVRDDSELSIAGLQNKVLLIRLPDGTWARPVHGSPSTHILKVDDPKHPGLILAEAACLTLAHAVGLANSQPTIVTLDDRDCIIVTRYDREVRDGRVVRVHQEDACQALDVNIDANRRRGKYEAYGGPSLAQIANQLDRHAADRVRELEQLVRQVVFMTLIGNADWHGKNVSLLHDLDGHIRLAPVYDTVPTMLWPKLRATAAMSIDSSNNFRAVTIDRIAAEAASWGLAAAAAGSSAREFADAVRVAVRDRDDELHRRIGERADRLLDS